MLRASATATTSRPASPSRRWPVTAAARDRLAAELVQLTAEVRRLAFADAEPDDAVGAVRATDLPAAQTAKRLERLEAVLADVEIVDEPERAAIGRRVTLRVEDGIRVSYTLVAPGEGNPLHGCVSADSPLGSAVLNRRGGDRVEIAAPGGRHSATIESVS